MEVVAAILRRTGGDFSIERLTLDAPRDGEVLVRVVATGICHTDAAVRDGSIECALPIVLGHEGAGIVQEVGRGVTKVGPGDHVVLTFDSCGRCHPCRSGSPFACTCIASLNFGGCRADGSHALHSQTGPLNDRFFAQSSFCTHAIAHERNVIPVPRDAPLELLGPLGCGMQTGAGAIFNALRIGPGASLAVFGCGAVGLAAIMAAKVAGASPIIGIDVVPSRLELARELGATHVVDGRTEDVLGAITAAVPDGVAFSLDTTGRPEVIRKAARALANRGKCGLVSAIRQDMTLELDAQDFIMRCKSVVGIIEGDSVPDILIPLLVRLHLDGKFPYDRLVRFYAFEDIGAAFADAASGRVVKPIIRLDLPLLA